MDKEKVLKLAKLARIELGSEEAESLSSELGSVLGYVGEIKDAKLSSKNPTKENFNLRNVMREDTLPHESGVYTEDILKQSPKNEGGYLVVKKIL